MAVRTVVNEAFILINAPIFLFFLLDLQYERSNLLGVRPGLRLMLRKDQYVHKFDLECSERREINAFFRNAIVKSIVRRILFGRF